MHKYEEQYKKIFDEFIKEATNSLKDAHSKLYTEYLPHVEVDTEININHICGELIEILLEGKYEIDDNGYVRLSNRDGYVCSLNLGNSWSQVSKVLAERHKDIIQNAEIERLKSELEYWKDVSNRRVY